MDQSFSNCECQCHFPCHIVCHVTSCCHCSHNYLSNYSPMNKKELNFQPMSSYSTNFRSFENSEGFQISPEKKSPTLLNESFKRAKSKDNYYTIRKMQQQHNNINNINSNRNYERPSESPVNNKYERSYINLKTANINNNNSFNNNNNIIPLSQSQRTFPEYPSSTPNFNTNSNINNINNINKPNNNTINNNNNNNLYSSSSPIYNTISNNNINTHDYSNPLKKIQQSQQQPEPQQPNALTYSYSENKNDDLPKKSKNNTPPQKTPQELQLENELQKANNIISSLKQENSELLAQRDDALAHFHAAEEENNALRAKNSQLEQENEDLKRRLNACMDQNEEKDAIIEEQKRNLEELDNLLHDRDQEIEELRQKIRDLQQEANDRINELNNRINDILREKDNLYRDFQKELGDLQEQIRNLKNQLVDAQMKIKELENKLKNQKRLDEKKQKLLERLFNFYNNMNKMLNTNTYTNKAPPKEVLNDVVNLQDLAEFQDKLDQIEEKLKQFIEDFKYKFGKCFACDIACCTSENERLKYFRNYYPGPPKK